MVPEMCHRERALAAAVLVVDSEPRHKFGEWLLGAISRAVRKIHYEYRLIIKDECNLTIRHSIRHVGDRALRPSEAQSSLDAATGRAKYCRTTVLFLWYRLEARTMKEYKRPCVSGWTRRD
uniref:Uncharacterized protein n=1 Tax=Hyaloperonospora arabidopsidis (strain Emoy2) TaxID=559515 RepID=M4B954_HYAAE